MGDMQPVTCSHHQSTAVSTTHTFHTVIPCCPCQCNCSGLFHLRYSAKNKPTLYVCDWSLHSQLRVISATNFDPAKSAACPKHVNTLNWNQLQTKAKPATDHHAQDAPKHKVCTVPSNDPQAVPAAACVFVLHAESKGRLLAWTVSETPHSVGT